MSYPEKCETTATSVETCRGLRECLEDKSSGQQNRLVYDTVYKLSKMQPRGTLIVLRSGYHRQNGICLNWCPFCGTDLQPARALVGVKEEA